MKPPRKHWTKGEYALIYDADGNFLRKIRLVELGIPSDPREDDSPELKDEYLPEWVTNGGD